MAAGLGFKDFVTGEVLTAADVDGYLMQGIWVFASAAARDAAVTSPQEGNFAYLKDTNVTTYYTGSAWANLDTTGMTNPMTTTGDIIYSSPGSTPVRLGIGTAGQVLKVNSGATAPEWGAAGGASGLTLIDEVSYTSSQTINVNDVFSSTYNNYRILNRVSSISGGGTIFLRFRVSGTDTSTNYYTQQAYADNTTVGAGRNTWGTDDLFVNDGENEGMGVYDIFNPYATAATQMVGFGAYRPYLMRINYGAQTDSTSFTGFTLLSASNATGVVSVYGYAKE